MSKTGLTLSLLLLAGCYFKSATHDTEEPSLTTDMDAEVAPGETQEDASADSSRPSDAGADASPRDAAIDAGPCAACLSEATPVCIPSTGQCVQCSADKACRDNKVCDTIKGECVTCLTNNDCKDANASVCDTTTKTCKACTNASANECDHITDKKVCAAGACVQCTSEKPEACVNAGTQFVCNASTHACDLNRKARSRRDCSRCVDINDPVCNDTLDCVSDLECQTGQACVDVAAGGGKKVCMPTFASGCARPYFTDVMGTNADGQSVRVCTFRTATTCLAHAHYPTKRCGMQVIGNAGLDQDNTANNSICGQPGQADGFCVKKALSPSTQQYLCTVPCNSSADDCPVGPATCALTAHQSGSANLCTL